MESGPVIPGNALNASSTYQAWYDTILSKAGCAHMRTGTTQLECLREVPFNVLNNALNGTANPSLGYSWLPAIDDDFVARYPSDQLRDGAFVKVPIIAGTASNEGTTQTPSPVNSTAELRHWMSIMSKYQYPMPDDLIDNFIKLYPNVSSFGIPSSEQLGGDVVFPQPYGAAFREAAAYFGDVKFIAGTRLTHQTWAKHGVPSYAYRFNTRPFGQAWEIGVAHFSDVAFIFNNLNGTGYKTGDPFQGEPQSYVELSYLMSNSWVSFVAEQDPNAWNGRGRNATRDDWPKYSVHDPYAMVWDANVTSFAAPDTWRKEGMALINKYQKEYYGR